jgi:hypothetical protein
VVPISAFRFDEGEQESAADWRSAALGIQRDAAAISRCSGRHAVDPWLTNKDGKQDAKEADDEHEIEQHESDRENPVMTTTVLPQKPATLLRLALALGTVKWEEPLDECAALYNNANMKCAPLARVLPITANLARFDGATG